jgi:hypothetical protein
METLYFVLFVAATRCFSPLVAGIVRRRPAACRPLKRYGLVPGIFREWAFQGRRLRS